jgi:hypothetical protein
METSVQKAKENAEELNNALHLMLAIKEDILKINMVASNIDVLLERSEGRY